MSRQKMQVIRIILTSQEKDLLMQYLKNGMFTMASILLSDVYARGSVK